MLKQAMEVMYRLFLPNRYKEFHELAYWKGRKRAEGALLNDHYEYFYTRHFGLSSDFYSGKRVLDIGCGPRGSLEWAIMASERIGLDPLATEYCKLGALNHKMRYVSGQSELIPFPDGYFDVVCAFNSLDHVSNLELTIAEIIRVLGHGGLFLLLSDVNHDATVCEPIEYSWNVVEAFQPQLELLDEKHYEKKAEGMYQSILKATPYYDQDTRRRYGVLSAKFRKLSANESICATAGNAQSKKAD